MDSAARFDFPKYLVPEVSICLISKWPPVIPSLNALQQAPSTVYYIPNFVSQDEADLLWHQVCEDNNRGDSPWHLDDFLGVCCSTSQMDSTDTQEIAKLGYDACHDLTETGREPGLVYKVYARRAGCVLLL